MDDLIAFMTTRSIKREIWHSTHYSIIRSWQGPRVVTAHDLIHEFHSEFFPPGVAKQAVSRKVTALQSADLVIAVSETTKEDLLSEYPFLDGRVTVVHNGVDTSVFLPRPHTATAASAVRPYFLYVGSRSAHKGFAVLLQALSDWRGGADLVIAGVPLQRSELRELERRNLLNCVRIVVNPSDRHLSALFSQALAFIYPSFYEGFGLPLLEAIACDALIVASDIPTTREVVESLPIYFDPGDANGLVDILYSLVEGRMPPKYSSADRERILSRFSWEAAAKATIDLYGTL